jgi:hypothetical protein
LEDQGEVFVADIHADRLIYLEDPALYLPAQKDGLGRKRMLYHSNAHALEVRKWVKRQPASAWRKKTLRGTTKGELLVEVLHRRVWLWDRKSSVARCWHLIVRREIRVDLAVIGLLIQNAGDAIPNRRRETSGLRRRQTGFARHPLPIPSNILIISSLN